MDQEGWEVFDPDEAPREIVGCRLWICAGCDTGTLEEYASFVFGSDLQTVDEQMYYSGYIPDRHVRHLQEKLYEDLPKPIQSIYREVIRSFNAELHLLCAMGIRALLEGVCANLQVRGRTLREMIDGLAPPIPLHIVQNLHTLRFLGNEAAHELAIPDTADLSLAIGVCEDVLNFLYQLNYRATQLAARRQARQLPPSSPLLQSDASSAEQTAKPATPQSGE